MAEGGLCSLIGMKEMKRYESGGPFSHTKEMSWKLICCTQIFLHIQTPGKATTDHPSDISFFQCCSANLRLSFLPRKRWQQTKPRMYS